MAKATIFVELDTTSVTTGSKVLTDQFGNALRTVQAQANTSFPAVTQKTDELSKTLGRLSSSRAPQFMGALTSSVAASIPAFQGSAAATGLLSTAAFGLQNILIRLVGPAGFILLAVTALTGFSLALKKTKEETDKLNPSLNDLLGQYVKLKEAGLSAIGTEAQIQKEIKGHQIDIKNLNVLIQANEKLLAEGSILQKLDENAKKRISEETNKFRIRIEQLTGELEDYNQALIKIAGTQEQITLDPFAKFRELPSAEELQSGIEEVTKGIEETKPVIEPFEIFAPEDITRMRAAIQINEALRVLGVLRNLETEKKQLQIQTIQNIASSFEDSFAEMLRGGKVAWDELLAYWYTQLLASAILAALSKLFGFSLGGGLFTSLFGFQTGTPFVPQTGAYLLHKGEAIIPAESNPFVNQTTNNWGGNTYNIYIRGEITEESIRRELLPKLKRMSEERSLIF